MDPSDLHQSVTKLVELGYIIAEHALHAQYAQHAQDWCFEWSCIVHVQDLYVMWVINVYFYYP